MQALRKRERDKESILWKRSSYYCSWGFTLYLVEFYAEEFLRGFLPCGFPEENICVLFCGFACLSFSDPLLMVMML